MRTLLKATGRGLFLFTMTLSFALGPIPKVNLAWAQESEEGCYKEGEDSESQRIYRPGCGMDDIVQKAQMSKYTDHQSSFGAIMEQAVAGMMAVVLLQSLRYKYLHQLENGTIYGNDCPANQAGKWSIRIAQLGALSYLLGDIKANIEFQKSSRKATDGAFGGSDEKTTKLGEANKQLRSFDTLIDVFKSQNKGLKTKMVLSSVAQGAYLASLGIDLLGITTCNGICAADLALQKEKFAEFETLMKGAIASATLEASQVYTLVPPCSLAVPALTAFQSLASTKNGIKLSRDIVESEARKGPKK